MKLTLKKATYMKQVDERQNEILSLLDQENKIYVADLGQKFNVSEVTIRKDLKELEERGLLKRVHGGAEKVRHERVAVESTMSELMVLNIAEKQAIARKALSFVEDGDALLLDASTTTRQLALILVDSDIKNLTIITPSLEIAHDLCVRDDYQTILIGGIVRPSLGTCMGPLAINMLKGLHADKAFIGVNGIDPIVGLTTQHILECEVKRTIIESSTRSFVLADSSKFNAVALGVVAPVTSVDYIISNAKLSPSLKTRIEECGVEVIVAEG